MFYDEIEKDGGACIGMGNYKNYDLWLAGMQNRHTVNTCQRGMYTKTFLFVIKKSALPACLA